MKKPRLREKFGKLSMAPRLHLPEQDCSSHPTDPLPELSSFLQSQTGFVAGPPILEASVDFSSLIQPTHSGGPATDRVLFSRLTVLPPRSKHLLEQAVTPFWPGSCVYIYHRDRREGGSQSHSSWQPQAWIRTGWPNTLAFWGSRGSQLLSPHPTGVWGAGGGRPWGCLLDHLPSSAMKSILSFFQSNMCKYLQKGIIKKTAYRGGTSSLGNQNPL